MMQEAQSIAVVLEVSVVVVKFRCLRQALEEVDVSDMLSAPLQRFPGRSWAISGV